MKSVSHAKAWGKVKVKNEEKLLFLVIVLLLNRKSQKCSDATTYTL